MALASVTIASGVFTMFCHIGIHYQQSAFKPCSYPFKPIMNHPYRTSAVAGNLLMAPGCQLLQERKHVSATVATMQRIR